MDNINFTVERGEKIVLVGVNGSGKSTIIKLLLRYYDPSSGCILVNGADIKEFDTVSLHKHISTYFQNSPIYAFSLRENMLLARSSDKENSSQIKRALVHADIVELVKRLPKGIDTAMSRMFDAEGTELSIGQQQKAALSRSFYRNGDIFILDEPTSSLDPEAEDKLFKHLESYCKSKTVIFTSHRLSNVRLATKIIVLENGIIVEEGTPAMLLKRKSRFSELFRYQADKYNWDISG